MTRVPFPPPRRQQEGVYTPDNLITGERSVLRDVTSTVTVPANTTYERGTLLGRVLGVETSRKAGNTGTLTLSAVSAGYQAQPGRYVVRVTTAGDPAAQRYTLYAPDGTQVDTNISSGNVAGGGGQHLTFTLTGTGADAVVGDEVYIDVVAARHAAAQVGATDGRQRPSGVLVNQLSNQTAAPVNMPCKVYTQGEFSWDEIDDVTPDGHGFTFKSLEARLAEQGLFLEEVIPLREVPLV